MTPESIIHEDSERVLAALAAGVSGDRPGALAHLKPIIERGPAAVFAMLSSFAEMTLIDQGRPRSGAFLGIVVSHVDGRSASIDLLPVGPRFAAQFTTAHTNGDENQTTALYRALLANENDQGGNLAEAIGATFDLAVAASRAIIQRTRAADVAGP